MQGELTERKLIGVVNELMRSPHGRLTDYLEPLKEVSNRGALFYAHFLAFAFKEGSVRDLRVSAPIIGARGEFVAPLAESNIAHLGKLNARDFVRALRFHYELNAAGERVTPPYGALIKRASRLYLRNLEARPKAWTGVALSNTLALKSIYALAHVKPNALAQRVLFDNDPPEDSAFWALANLRNLSNESAAAAIKRFHLPAPKVISALGRREYDPVLLTALIDVMTANQVRYYATFIETRANGDAAVLRAVSERIAQGKSDNRVDVMKLRTAAGSVKSDVMKAAIDDGAKAVLKENELKGRWLIAFDMSGSMRAYLDVAKVLAYVIANYASRLHLIAFDVTPAFFDLTGMNDSAIDKRLRQITAGGSTAIGAPIAYIRRRKLVYDDIVFITDGQENSTPYFETEWQKYTKSVCHPNLYYVQVGGFDPVFFDSIEPGVMKIRPPRGADLYSLPAMISMLRSDAFGLLDRIMSTKLLTFADVFRYV